MSSRMKHRTLVLTLALSTGALALPPAQAAPARSAPPPAPVTFQSAFSSRGFLETVQSFWGWLKDSPGHHEGHGDHSGPGKEGSGVCPHGGGPGH